MFSSSSSFYLTKNYFIIQLLLGKTVLHQSSSVASIWFEIWGVVGKKISILSGNFTTKKSIFKVKFLKNFDFLGNFPKYFNFLGRFPKNFNFFRQFHKNIDFQGPF